MTALLFLLFLGQGSAGTSSTTSGEEDRPIIEAVLADPTLFGRTDFGRFDLFQMTHLAAMVYVEPPFDTIQLDGSQVVFTLPVDLIESVRLRNARGISIKGMRRPRPTPRSGANRVNVWRSVSVSRPGVTADGLKALVVVLGTEGDCRGRSGCAHGGFNVYLERRDGLWRVGGHGGSWIE
jgi:hypothetical protein